MKVSKVKIAGGVILLQGLIHLYLANAKVGNVSAQMVLAAIFIFGGLYLLIELPKRK